MTESFVRPVRAFSSHSAVNCKKQTEKHTGRYAQAKDVKQQSVEQINHSLNQFREQQDKKLRSPLHVLF